MASATNDLQKYLFHLFFIENFCHDVTNILNVTIIPLSTLLWWLVLLSTIVLEWTSNFTVSVEYFDNSTLYTIYIIIIIIIINT